MRIATRFPIYHLPGSELGEAGNLIGELGLETRPLEESADLGRPGLLILTHGQKAPKGWAARSLELPAEAPPSLLRSLLQLGMENTVLKSQLEELELDAFRHQRQFQELNRIGIALSSERDLAKLQELILSTCRQLTKADGASLFLVEGDGEDRLLRFSHTQSHSIPDEYHSFTVPINENSMVGYTVISGKSQLVEDAYNLPPGTAFGWGGRALDDRHGYRTRSMLSVPMRNHSGEVVGVVQFVNAKRSFETVLSLENADQEVVSFAPDSVQLPPETVVVPIDTPLL